MEQRWNARAGGTGDPRENPPTNDITPQSSAYWSFSCVFIGCCPTPGSHGIRKVFPYKSAIGSEACRAGLINCHPISKVTSLYTCLTSSLSRNEFAKFGPVRGGCAGESEPRYGAIVRRSALVQGMCVCPVGECGTQRRPSIIITRRETVTSVCGCVGKARERAILRPGHELTSSLAQCVAVKPFRKLHTRAAGVRCRSSRRVEGTEMQSVPKVVDVEFTTQREPRPSPAACVVGFEFQTQLAPPQLCVTQQSRRCYPPGRSVDKARLDTYFKCDSHFIATEELRRFSTSSFGDPVFLWRAQHSVWRFCFSAQSFIRDNRLGSRQMNNAYTSTNNHKAINSGQRIAFCSRRYFSSQLPVNYAQCYKDEESFNKCVNANLNDSHHTHKHTATKTGSTATETGSTATETGSTATKTSSTATKTGSTATKTGSAATKTGSAATKTGSTATRTGSTATKTGSTATKTGSPATKTGSTATKTGSTATRTGSTTTKTGSTATKTGSTATKTGSTATKTGSTATRTGSTATKTGSGHCNGIRHQRRLSQIAVYYGERSGPPRDTCDVFRMSAPCDLVEPMRVVEVNMEQHRNEGAGDDREILEKTRRPTASSGTIPTRPGIERGLPWWEASVLIAQPPWHPNEKEGYARTR
ncbi:hypothetical protein PR048_025697 [Dryococelus australis]|uniref:Uncharacterized protein n=1 Tax=Dryococelus australis TaxID=614101 RepID=A0ABQ9GJ99_9NEOP|nr:hypothetical protein PR048_025697 [Dryococelus australis]